MKKDTMKKMGQPDLKKQYNFQKQPLKFKSQWLNKTHWSQVKKITKEM